MKRCFDIWAAGLALTLLFPMIAALSALVRLDSTGPAFFSQARLGRGFRRFRILKFRTMVCDASQAGGLITVGNDPRITRVGRVLRAMKLDELPQLFNVLRGEMSFVGPRPEVPEYVELFRDDFEEILKVRPGITDLASIAYRNESRLLGEAAEPEQRYVQEIMPEKIRLAKEYVRRQSLWLDLTLIVATVWKLTCDLCLRVESQRREGDVGNAMRRLKQ